MSSKIHFAQRWLLVVLTVFGSILSGFLAFAAFDYLFKNETSFRYDASHIYYVDQNGFYRFLANVDSRACFGPVPCETHRTGVLGNRIGSAGYPDGPSDTEIFFFGDSFTYGVGLPYEATFIGRLQKAGIPVINMAVPSYAPTATRHLIRELRKSGHLTPRNRVILAADLTDISDEYFKYQELPLDDQYLPFIEDPSMWKRWLKNSFPRTWQVYLNARYWQQFRFPFIISRNKIAWRDVDYSLARGSAGYFNSLSKDRWEPWMLPALHIYEQKLEEVIYEAAGLGSEVHLFIYPHASELVDEKSNFDHAALVKSVCARLSDQCHGVIDAGPMIRKKLRMDSNALARIYFPNDIHYATYGHALQAHVLAEHFRQED